MTLLATSLRSWLNSVTKLSCSRMLSGRNFSDATSKSKEDTKAEKSTVSYSAPLLPDSEYASDPETFIRREWWIPSGKVSYWTDWKMLKDFNRRKIVAEHAPLRLRLKSLKDNKLLPKTFREEIAVRMAQMPAYTSINKTKNMCQFTARRRGNVIRYRLSRIVFRHLADHGKISGVIRAKWG